MRYLLPVAAALALTACAPAPAVVAPAPAPASVTVEAAFGVAPAPVAKAFGLLGRPIQRRFTPNVEAAITHIEAWLHKGEDGEWSKLGDLPADQRTVVVNNLKLSTSYALRLRAFKEDPDAKPELLPDPIPSYKLRVLDTTPIKLMPPEVQMSDDAASTATFNTNADDGGGFRERRTLDLTLQLSNQVFSGSADGNITVEDGTLSSTEDAEALAPTAPVGHPLPF